MKVVWTSAAEFPGTIAPNIPGPKYNRLVYSILGIIITLIIIELIGRKITMAVEFIGTGLAFGLLLICVPE